MLTLLLSIKALIFFIEYDESIVDEWMALVRERNRFVQCQIAEVKFWNFFVP